MAFDIFVQSLGFIAIAMNLIAVQFNTHGKIMLFKSLGSLLFAFQYLLLGAFAGMAMDLIGTIRNVIFTLNVKNNRSNKWCIVLFAIITLAFGVSTIILTWDTTLVTVSRWSNNADVILFLAIAISITSIVAKLLTTIAYGFKSPHVIRMTNIPSCACWIAYNFTVFSIAGIVNEIMTITSIVIAEIRFRKPKDN